MVTSAVIAASAIPATLRTASSRPYSSTAAADHGFDLGLLGHVAVHGHDALAHRGRGRLLRAAHVCCDDARALADEDLD